MFEEIIGNDRSKAVLSRLKATDRIPQSLLFAGKSGIGKRLFALELAKLFVCRDLPGGEPCGRCSACERCGTFKPPRYDDRDEYKKVVFTDHPDVGFLLPHRQTIFIDAVRDLEKEANFRPFEARARIFIIDDAEKLSAVKENAANALLKTLEEPSETTYIILLSSRPLLLLSTIRSRCQTVAFAPIEKQRIADYLVANRDLPSEDAALLAGVSRGSLGRALETDPEVFRRIRGNMLEVVASACQRRNFAALLRRAEEMSDPKKRSSYDLTLDTLQTLIHDLWTLKHRDAPKLVNFDIAAELEEIVEKAEAGRLSDWLKGIEDLREDLGFNINRKLATDSLFMQMAS